MRNVWWNSNCWSFVYVSIKHFVVVICWWIECFVVDNKRINFSLKNIPCHYSIKSWIKYPSKVCALLLNLEASYSVFNNFWLLHPVDNAIFNWLLIKVVIKMIKNFLWTNCNFTINKILS
jgi:hypothetical protein